jgi:protein TonB
MMANLTSRFALLVAIPFAFAANVAMADTATLDTKFPCDKPEYPRASLVNEEQGTVVLALQISTDGKVMDSKVEKSSGYKNLDKATMKLAGCKFKPMTKDGKAEEGWAKFEYSWTLS